MAHTAQLECLDDERRVEFLEGLLDSSELAAVERHLDHCETCRALIAASAEPPAEHERYETFGVLGRGAMGVVYEARDVELDRRVALKVLQPERALDEHGRIRILREARALAQLSHPNVVAIYDVGELDAEVFIAMEFIDGQTLGQWCQGKDHSEILARYIEVGRGLAAAHQTGVVHRDVKPANALVGRDGRARVVDFGLASGEVLSESQLSEDNTTLDGEPVDNLTSTGAVVGTPAYMAPEQMCGRPATAASDQFSFCVALYEALYGHRPFRGDTMGDLLNDISEGPPRPPHLANIPRRVGRVLRKGLSAAPKRRFASMMHLVKALEETTGRRRLAVAGAGLLVSAGLFSAAGGMLDEEDPCATVGRRAYNLWTDEQRLALHARFEDSASSFAPQTRKTLESRLDNFAERWGAARSLACKNSSEDVSATDVRRVRCLEKQLRQRNALFSVMMDPSLELRQASEVSALLPDPSRCSQPAATHTESETVSADAQRLETVLDEAMALYYAMEGRAAVTRLDREPWDRVEDPNLRARAQVLRGLATTAVDDSPAAVDRMQQTCIDTIEAGLDEVAAKCSADLMWIMASRSYPGDEVDRWVRHARSLADRSGDDLDQAYFSKKYASVLHFGGRPKEAEVQLQRALEVFQEQLPPDDDRLVALEHTMGSNAMGQGQFDRAHRHFSNAVEHYTARYGATHPSVLRPLRGLVAIAMKRGDYETALATLEKTDAIIKERWGDDDAEFGTSLMLRANCISGQGQFDEALPIAQRARAILHETAPPNDPRLRGVATVLGTIHSAMGNHAAARLRYLDVLAAAERVGATAAVANAHANVGLADLRLERFDSAQEHLRAAQEGFVKLWGPDAANLAFVWTGLAQIEMAQGNPGKARELFAKALARPTSTQDTRALRAETQLWMARAIAADTPTGAEMEEARKLAQQAADRFAELSGYEQKRQEALVWLRESSL